MKCHKCGCDNGSDSRFCRSCGQEFPVGESTVQISTISTGDDADSGEFTFDDYIINNRFKIKKKLGQGGMGTIFHARDLKLKRDVAIKCISKKNLSDTFSRGRFLREAQTASQLEHANICAIYEIYEEEKNNYIVMQYVDGVTLDHIISLKKLSINKILDISIQICEGMIEAHSKGIVHRDIKPANIIVDQKGLVKILDFGLAKFRDESIMKKKDKTDSTHSTEKGILMGTVSYMSPEQARGEKLESRSDIFSFGIVLYEMLEGINPYQDRDHICTLYNVINKKIEFIREIPDSLKKIVLKAVEKEASDRYPDFKTIKEELEQFGQIYNLHLKETEIAGFKTDIIKDRDQDRRIKELQPTSDKEGLGDIVYRIKKIKARTEPLFITQKKVVKIAAIPLIAIVAIAIIILISRIGKENINIPETNKKFFIYLHDFENHTGDDDLSEKFNYLLYQSLNQFNGFKTINQDIASSIDLGMDSTAVARPVSGKSNSDYRTGHIHTQSKLLKKYNVLYELNGVFTKFNDFYNIDAVLTPLVRGQKRFPITVPVKDKDALLCNQVETLTKRVYLSIFSNSTEEDLNIKKLSKMYGNRWETFSLFFKGMQYYKKLQISDAERYLTRSSDLAISKYLLSDIYYFKGKREESIRLIQQIIPHIDQLTESLQLQILALQARLEFNFAEEIKNLNKYKDDFSFRVEGFFELGEAHFHHGNANAAIPFYHRALEISPRYSKAINHLGYCYSYLGDHNRAIQLFEDYRNLDQSANSFDSLGDGYFYAGDLISAEALKLAAISTDSAGVPWSLLSLADIYILKAEYKKVIPVLKQYNGIVLSKKELARSLTTEAYSCFVEQEYEKTLAFLNQSVMTYNSQNINDYTVSEAHWLKGLVLLILNRIVESKQELEWLSELKEKYNLSDSNFYIPLKYLFHLQALIFEKEKNLAESHKYFNYLLKLKSRLSYWSTPYHYQFFHTEYIKFLIRNQKFLDALRETDSCLEFNKNYIPCLWQKADILEKIKQPDQALKVYQKIKELYGESKENNRLRNVLRKKISELKIGE